MSFYVTCNSHRSRRYQRTCFFWHGVTLQVAHHDQRGTG